MAITASGNVIRKTDPHQKCSRHRPARNGPSDAMAAPSPDQSAIDRVRPRPDHNAVINASVVGNAMPAARPPPTRAATSTPVDGAHAASSEKGTASAVPATSSSLRP